MRLFGLQLLNKKSGKTFVRVYNKFLLACITLALFASIASAGTIYVPNDYPTIQEAINNAADGDTIVVYPGTYTENIIVNKSVAIIGHAGSIVTSTDWSLPVFRVTANNVHIEGFNITGDADAGVDLENVVGCVIINNTIKVDSEVGVNLKNTTNCNISNNIVDDGIYLENSPDNVLWNNYLTGNGISIDSSPNLLMRGNKVETSSSNGFYISGDYVADYLEDIDVSNTINNRPIYYVVNGQDMVLDSSTNASFIALVSCNNITVRDVAPSNAGYGVLLVDTTNSKIINVTTSYTKYGIRLFFSSNNDIIDCTPKAGGFYFYGVVMENSSYNTVSGGVYYAAIGLIGSDHNVIYNTSHIGRFKLKAIFLEDSDYNIINKNTIEGQNGHPMWGIYVVSSYYNEITNNVIHGLKGSYVSVSYPILIENSAFNVVDNNTLYSNSGMAAYENYNIKIRNSHDNIITNNTAYSSEGGIGLVNSFNNQLHGNILYSNTHNFGVESSIGVKGYINYIDATNTIDDKPIYYIVNVSGYTFPEDAGYIAAVNCKDVTIRNITLNGETLHGNWQDILIVNSSDVVIEGVDIDVGFGNRYGIEILNSSDVEVRNSSVYNAAYGIFVSYLIYIDSSSGCRIENNELYVSGSDIIRIIDSNNITIYGNDIRDAKFGIWGEDSDDIEITNNLISGCDVAGIEITGKRNILEGNQICYNDYGIWYGGLDIVRDNLIYNNHVGIRELDGALVYNNYFRNYDYNIRGSDVTLNTTVKPGPNIVGGPYIGGNYWGKPDGTGFSQTHPDSNGDGFCDESYVVVSGSIDYHPLKDSYPPSLVMNLHVVDKDVDYISWAWDNPEDWDFDHVEVYLNGDFITNTTQNSFTATGLNPATNYTITLYTVDDDGNVNLNGVQDSETTSSAEVVNHTIESPHPYENNCNYVYNITEPDACKIKVHFVNYSVEAWDDYIYVYDKNWNRVERYTGYDENVWTPWIEGDVVRISLVSDSSNTDYGFYIDKYVYTPCGDATPPSVVIHSPENVTYPTSIIQINVSASDSSGIGTVIANIDGITNVTLNPSNGYYVGTTPPLSDGGHWIRIYANDSLGNTNSSEIVYFSIRKISSCTNIIYPGYYYLSTDILNSHVKFCINITSSDVVLDGKGNTIDGIDSPGTYGVYVYNPMMTLTNVTVMNLRVTDWEIGIYLGDVDNGTIKNNTFSSNNYGIYLVSSDNNKIYNNLFNNTNNVGFGGTACSNIWNVTKTPGENILGGNYLGGNAWLNPSGAGFSQTCSDSDNDTICDTSYQIDTGNIDYLPLVFKVTPSPTPTPTPTPTPKPSGRVSGGGGGGGIELPEFSAPLANAFVTSKFFTKPEQTLQLSENQRSQTDLLSITVKLDKSAYADFWISKPSSLPESIPSPPINLYTLVEIIVTKHNTNEVIEPKEGYIEFRVSKDWLNQNQYDPSLVAMLRWNGKEWQELETEYLSEDDGYYYFKAYLPGFSIYAIGTKLEKEVTPTPAPTPTQTPIPTPEVTETPVQPTTAKITPLATQSPEAKPTFSIVFIGAIAVAAIVVIGYALKKMRK